MTTILTQQEIDSLKESFIAGVNQILTDQKTFDEDYAKLVDAVNQSKLASESNGTTVKLTDLFEITHISDELTNREEELKERALKLFHTVTPSNIFVSQEFYDTWIEVNETMFVKFDYMADRLVVKRAGEMVST